VVDQAEIHRKATDGRAEDRQEAAEIFGKAFSEFPDKYQAWRDLITLTQDKDSVVRGSAVAALGAAFSQVPDKMQAWQDLIALTQDNDSDILGRIASSLGIAFEIWCVVPILGSAFKQVPDKKQAWRDLITLIQDKDFEVRWRAANVLETAISQVPDKTQVWRDLITLTQDKDFEVRRWAANVLETAISQVPDKTQVWQDLHRLTQDKDSVVRGGAVSALGAAFSQVPDKTQAWQDLHRLTQDKDFRVRRRAANVLETVISQAPDKMEAWQDVHRLTKDEDNNVRFNASYSLGVAFSQVPDKMQAWQDLTRLTENRDSEVRRRAANALRAAFSQVPDKMQAWQDLIRLKEDNYYNDLTGIVANALGIAFSRVHDKAQAWQDLHKLTRDHNNEVRKSATYALGTSFSQAPDKMEAWQDLIMLTKDEDNNVRFNASYSLGVAFSQVPDKMQAWQDLIRLTQNEDSDVRTYAYYSLGRASVYNATESEDIDGLRRYLEEAVRYFEKSAQESKYSPARFCHPFYRSYFAITFQRDSQEAVQNYLAVAKDAVGGSESRDQLLKAVENLAGALQEAQRTKDMQLAGMQCDLKAYMRYCNQATEYLNHAEADAPGAAKLIRKGLPNIDQQIKKIIDSIQEKSRTICIQGKGKGTALEAAGLELNHWAKELSFEDILKSERSCSRIEYTLQNFCNRIPESKKSNLCEVVREIGQEEELPSKLTKIELALSYILNEWPIDYDVRKKLDEIFDRFKTSEQKILSSVFERLDKDKLEIVCSLLDAIKENKIPKELTEETLKATKDFITEIKSMQIQDPELVKCVDSWEDAMNSPELGIENMIKVTIPIIPFLLTYEGSYKFQTGLKLDSVWDKLRAFIRR
jgi:HEAT repeat protein